MQTQITKCWGCGKQVTARIDDRGEIQELDSWVIMVGQAVDGSKNIGPVLVENNDVCKAKASAALFSELPEAIAGESRTTGSHIIIMPTGPVTYMEFNTGILQ